MNKLINSFNQENTLLAITSFPSGKNFNAVGWHSQKTLSQLSSMKKILVCAEYEARKTTKLINENLLVVSSWQKSKILSFASLFYFIMRQNKISSIFVQFEFNVFGGTIPNLALMSMLFILKILGKHISFELHQVIKDVGALEKHVNIKNYFLKKFFNFGLKIYYILIGFVADNIIVFEQELKDRLQNLISLKKIEVLSIGVSKRDIIPNNEAKNQIKIDKNKFTLLVFGFINGYKGIDWILKNKILKNKKISLLITGGKNPYLKNKAHYKHFYTSILKEASKHPNVILSGFVPENKISLYFAASDLVVMPYEVFMSASGPFSLAIEHERPVILSNILADYQKSDDFKRTMNMANLKKQDLFFKLDQNSLSVLVKKAIKNKDYYSRLCKFSKILSEARSISYSSLKLYDIVSKSNNIDAYALANLHEQI
jgi:glycosyltransferase involved in cell wall biosynthesis